MKLAETLVGLVLMLLVLSGVVAFVMQATRLARHHADQLEAHQRVRVAFDLVARELRSAGAGIDRGPATGALVPTAPSVWPRRLGRGGDPPQTVRTDGFTAIAVPDTVAQTRTAGAAGPDASLVLVEAAAHCPVALPACGFSAGLTTALFAPGGPFTLWVTEDVLGDMLSLRPLAATGAIVPSGAVVAELRVRGYFHDPSLRQLRSFDGQGAGQPVIDGVTGLTVRYFDDTAELPASLFADGPWLGAGDLLFDADLLRVRRVRVELALTAGAALHHAAVEVAPRNAGGGAGSPGPS